MKRSRIFERALTIILILIMLVSMVPANTRAENENSFLPELESSSGSILYFESIEFETAYQLVDLGTSLDQLILPDTLRSMVRFKTKDSSSEYYDVMLDLDMHWVSHPNYDSQVEGEYIFKPLGLAYECLTDLPEIIVYVEDLSSLQIQEEIAKLLRNLQIQNTYTYIWDGSEDITLKDGESADLDFGETSFASATLTIEDNATVTINKSKEVAPFYISSDSFIVGDNARVNFTGDGDTVFGIDIHDRSLVLRSLDSITKLSTDNSYNLENESFASLRLEGSGTNGFIISSTLKTKDLVINGGSHYIGEPLEQKAWMGNHALILSDGGSLGLNGDLVLQGESCGTDIDSPLFIGGTGLFALGKVDINIEPGSNLVINGGNEHDLAYGEASKHVHGGPATVGEVHIYFNEINGDATSSLTLQNGADFEKDQDRLGVPNVSNSVFVNKPSGAYLTGTNWLYQDEEEYNMVSSSSDEGLVLVSPPYNEQNYENPGTGETPASFLLSTSTPDTIYFTAKEYGGEKGITDSLGIEIRLNIVVDNLPKEAISISNANIGTPVQDVNNKALWRVLLTKINGETDHVISQIAIADFDDFKVKTETTDITLYKKVTKNISVTLEQKDGIDKVADSSKIEVTFSQEIDNLPIDLIQLTGANYQIIEQDQDNPLKWFIYCDEFENGSLVTLTIFDWMGDENWFSIENNGAQVTLYKDIRYEITYTAEQIGGSPELVDTSGIKLTFSHEIDKLTIDQIELVGKLSGSDVTLENIAYIQSIVGSGKNWTINFSSITPKANLITISIKDSNTYVLEESNREKTLVVYALTVDIWYVASQVGGFLKIDPITLELLDIVTTKGILLEFNRPLSRPQVEITGARLVSIDDYQDNDARTWYVAIDDIEVDNGDIITIKVLDFDGLNLADPIKEVRVYIKEIIPIKVKVNQVGGIDGEKLTESIEIHYETTSDEEFISPPSSYIDVKGVSLTGTGVFASKRSLLGIAGIVKNQQVVTVSVRDWQRGDKFFVVVEQADPINVFSDTRRYIKFTKVFGNGGSIGRRPDKEIIFAFNDPSYDESKFGIDDLEVIGATKGDELYKDEDGSWHLSIKDVDPYADHYLIINNKDKGYSILENKKYMRLAGDTRPVIGMINVEEVGGVVHEIDTQGILLTLDRPYYTKDLGDKDQEGIILDFEISIKVKETGKNISYSAYKRKIDGPEQVFLKFRSWPFEEGAGAIVEIFDDINSIKRMSPILASLEVRDLHKSPPPAAIEGVVRSLDGIYPGFLYKDSQYKQIILQGVTGGEKSPLVMAEIRRYEDENRDNWTTIAIPRQQSANQTFVTLDCSYVSAFNQLGHYEIRFVAEDEFRSQWRSIMVTENISYSQDTYGIMVIAQESDKALKIYTLDSENQIEKAIGNAKSLMVFRGEIVEAELQASTYLVKSGTVINNILTYYVENGTSTMQIKQNPNGDIEILARAGDLKWKNIAITGSVTGTDDRIKILLDHTKKYKNNRLDEEGADVEITTGINNFSINFVIGKAHLSTYRLYDGECSFSGGVELGIPEWLAGSFEAGVDVEQVVLDSQVIPGIKASAKVEFKPGGLLGDGLGDLIGGGGVLVEIDTLPETENRYIAAKGEMDIADMLYLRGEIVLMWGKTTKNGQMIFVPDKLEFFARIGEGGVPLVPPLIVAYINGIGGGIYDLYDTVTKGFEYIPPVSLSLKGAIVDATGSLVSIDETTLNVGIGKFSASVDEATVLKFLKIEDATVAFGLRDGGLSKYTNKKSVDLYFNAGGSIKIEVGVLNLGGRVEVKMNLYGAKFQDALIEAMAAGTLNEGQIKEILEAFNISGSARGYAYLDLGVLGKPGVDLTLSASLKRLSGSVDIDLLLIKRKVTVVYNIGGGVNVNVTKRMAIGPEKDDEVLLMNVFSAGSYRPNMPQVMVMKGALKTPMLVPFANDAPFARVDHIATIFSDKKYSQVAVYKDGAYLETLDMDYIYWFDTHEDYLDLGQFSMNYLVVEEGQYEFKGVEDIFNNNSQETTLAYELTEIAPVAEFVDLKAEIDDLDKNKLSVNWNLNDIGNADEDLFVKLVLVDKVSNSPTMDLTMAIDQDQYPLASTKSTVLSLPQDLESNDYYIAGQLMKKDSSNELYTIDLMDSNSFTYENPAALKKPNLVSAKYMGNGAFNLSWEEVHGADGYIITILDQEDYPLPGLTQIVKAANETSTIIQGGTTMDSFGRMVGLEFEREYKYKVQAFKSEYLALEEREITILGKPNYILYSLPAFSLNNISVLVSNSNGIKDDEGKISYYATNSNQVEMLINLESEAQVRIYVNDIGEPFDLGTNTSFSFVPTFSEDGTYHYLISTIKENGDHSEEEVIIEVDRVAPSLNVDRDSLYAFDGKVHINGYTEIGCMVTINDVLLEMDGGLFNYSENLDMKVKEFTVISYDEAGNSTRREIVVSYVTYDAESVELDKTELTLYADSSANSYETLSASVKPSYASNKDVVWTSSNPQIARVDQNGKVTALSGGLATITVTTVDGNYTAQCLVTVKVKETSDETNKVSSIVTLVPPSSSPNSPTHALLRVEADVMGNQAFVDMEIGDFVFAYESAMSEASKNGYGDNGISLVIEIETGNEAVNDVNFNLTRVLQNYILSKNIDSIVLKVDNPEISLSLNREAIQEINRQANGQVNIRVQKMDETDLTNDLQDKIGGRPLLEIEITYGDRQEISNFAAGGLEVSIPYTLQDKEKPEDIYAVYIAPDGKIIGLIGSFYDTRSGMLHFTTNHLSMYAVANRSNGLKFTDIQNHWAKEDISYLTSIGLLAGTSENLFSPNLNITRAMFVTVLGRLAQVEKDNAKISYFADLEKASYYAAYAQWAFEKAIANGTGDKKFSPNMNITREQIAVMLLNYAKAIGFTLPKLRDYESFADSNKISGYAQEAVENLYSAGIINGKDKKVFDPQGLATRAEAVAMIYRFIKVVESKMNTDGWSLNDTGKWTYYENGKLLTGKQVIDNVSYSFDKYGETSDIPKNLRYTVYTSQKEDSLWIIASKTGTCVSEIERLNNYSKFTPLDPGHVFRVQAKKEN